MTSSECSEEDTTSWLDISVCVDPDWTPLWPGSPAVTFDRRLSVENGDSVNATTLTCGVHTGTHVDAPAHYIRGGATVEGLELNTLVGCCEVVNLEGVDTVKAIHLEHRVKGCSSRVLLKTDNSERWSSCFREDFTGVSVEAARWVAERDIRLLGIDYLSVQPFSGSDDVHRILLEDEVVLLEGIDLSRVSAGKYELLCLPVKLAGVEAAPARALLRPVDN